MTASHDPEAEFIERELGGQYQLVRRLGHGAMGVVYLARDRVLHRMVAIKTLRRDRSDSPEERERFRGEARLSVQLAHPGIVSVYTFGETASLLYIVMQYVGGGSLADRLARTERATPDETRRLLLELADVLDYAHRQGVIHRDIKPENILLAGAEPAVRPLLADFGVAAQPLRDRGAGSAQLAAGTAHYMSPEQLWGESDVDRRSDLYSLGVLGYRLLAGRPPYDGASAEHVSAKRATSVHVPIHDAAPHAPRALCDVIERCLHEEPERRWRNARELHAALLRCDARPPLAARVRARLRGSRRSATSASETTSMSRRPMNEQPSGPARALPFDGVLRDARYAVRALARTPAFVAVAVLCLALGIGANAAIFSVVNAVLLRPMPFAAPERLVRVYETFNDNPGSRGSVSVPNLTDWREQARGFEQLAAYQLGSANLQGSERPERLLSSEVSPNLFALLGARALLGRTFALDEDQPGREHVAVISEALWRRRFAADPSIVGRSVTLDGTPHTVVGVLPASFRFPVSVANDVWIPFAPSDANRRDRGSHFLSVIGRLKPGVTLEEADAEMRAIAARLAEQYPDEQAGRSTFLMPYREAVVGRVRPALLVLLGAVGLVLLIACANVANLLLARAATRRREVAIRLALGASRTRIVRQLLTESVLLGLAGAVAGALLAWLGLRALAPMVDGALPMAGGVRLDLTVFAYLLGAAVLSGILFGLVPALQSTRGDVREDLTDGAKSSLGRSQQRFRGALVVSEIALSLVLLVGAGLLMRGFLTLRGVEPGFDASGLLTLHVAVPGRFDTIDEAVAGFVDPVRERLRQLPGVQGVGLTTLLPVQESGYNGNFEIDGRPRAATPAEEPFTELRMVSPGYFEAMRIPLKAGRALAESDGVGGARNILVNEALAEKYFGGAAAVGQRIRRDDASSVWHTIVGIVGDVRQHGLTQEPAPEMYYSHRDSLGPARGELVFVVRSAVPPATLVAGARAAVQAVAPDQPVFRALTMEEVLAESLADRRLNLWLLGVFASVALVLSAAGLYGVISYLVAQRSREIGIRMALGAQTGDVTRLVMRQGAGLTALGVAVGLLGALALTRLLANMLYGVSTRDPLTFVAVAAMLAGVALAATYVPARRAARVNPLRAIRAE